MSKKINFLILILVTSLSIASCQAEPTTAGTGTTTSTAIVLPTKAPTGTPEIVVEPTTTSSPEAMPTSTNTLIAPTLPTCFVTYDTPIAFLPDNNRILIKGLSGVQIFNLGTLQEESFIKAPTNLNTPAVALSPDGETLAWALEDYRIELIRIADKQLIHTLAGHTDMVTKLRFSPTGDRLVSASHDDWVRIWDRDGKQVNAFQPGGGDALGIGISPDGTMLATVPFDGSVSLWDLAEFQAIVDVGGSGGFDTSDVAFSPDGQFIAADLATGLSVWKAADQTLLWSGINSMAFDFSPDGRFLAYSDIGENNNVVLSSPDGTQRMRTLEGHQGPVWAMIFSPDSTRLASADGIEIRIWQVEGGELLYVGKSACP